MFKELIKNNWIHLVALLIFFCSTMVLFFPSFQGKKLQQGDMIHWQGMSKEIKDYKESTGEDTYWTNSMFGGMPSYYIQFGKNYGPIDYFRRVISLGMKREVGHSIMGLISFYILLLVLRVSPVLSIIGALAFVYTTNNIVLLDAGHYTKLATLMTSPLVIAGVILAYKKKLIPGLILFAVGLSLNLKAQHPQMTYYLGLVLLIYVIIEFIAAIRSGDLPSFLKTSAGLLLGALLAIGTTANKTLPIYEYSKDTMRGAPILKESKSNDSSSKVDGLAWEYAMAWSNGPEDLLQSFISHSVGGSSGELISSTSKFAKELKKRGVSTRNMQAPLYWGSLPFTSGPIYFGAIIWFLMFLAAFNVKGSVKVWVITAVIFTFMLSLGKNLEWFNRLFFDYFPLYNKFRTPNSLLSVTAIIIPLLGILGLKKVLEKDVWTNTKILYPGLAMIVMTILIGLLGPGIFDMTSTGDLRLQQAGIDPGILIDDRASMLRSSAMKAAFYMGVTLLLIYSVSRDWIKQFLAVMVIGALIMIDLFSVNLKYVSPSEYVSSRKYDAHYTPRQVDKQILTDKDPHYRVLDNSINTFNSSFASYFHKTVGGYHAAKLQRYQDMIDYHISKGNNEVMNMLNTKYVITGQQGQEQSRLNTAALGNAWFVNKVRFVETADKEIEALNSFDPLGEAIVHSEYKDQVGKIAYDKTGATIKLTSYAPSKLTYKTQAGTDQLAVFSEVWYGPNKGWKASIDGKEVPHLRANYILRALTIPAGSHEVVFEFAPDSIKTGNLIALLCNLLILALIAFFFWGIYSSTKTLKSDHSLTK